MATDLKPGDRVIIAAYEHPDPDGAGYGPEHGFEPGTAPLVPIRWGTVLEEPNLVEDLVLVRVEPAPGDPYLSELSRSDELTFEVSTDLVTRVRRPMPEAPPEPVKPPLDIAAIKAAIKKEMEKP